MGRGLSDLQKKILTISYEINGQPATFDVIPCTKPGNSPLTYKPAVADKVNFPTLTEARKQADVFKQEGYYPAIQVADDKQKSFGHKDILSVCFKTKTNAARVSVSRALSRLIERELLVYAHGGYLLTIDGFELAKELTVNNVDNVQGINH